MKRKYSKKREKKQAALVKSTIDPSFEEVLLPSKQGKVDFTKNLNEGFEDAMLPYKRGTMKDFFEEWGDKLAPLTAAERGRRELWTEAAGFFLMVMFFVAVGIAMKSIV